MKKAILHVHGHAKRHYEKHYRTHYRERAHLVFLLDTVLVVTALALLALGFYFSRYYRPLRDSFRLDIATVGETVGAQESEIVVRIENVGKEALTGGQLMIHLPKSFLASDGQSGTRTVDVGLLPEGASFEERFRGMPVGAPGTARIVAHYQAKGPKGRHDERLTAGDLRWERSLIETRFDAPTSVIPGQTVRFRLEAKNGTDAPLDNASLKVTWPDGFRLVSSTPPVYRGAVALGTLDAGETVHAEFTARFLGAADRQRLSAELSGRLGDAIRPLYAAQADVLLADAGLELSAAFASGTPAFVRPGEEVPVTVRWRNGGSRPLTGVTLGINEDPRAIAAVRWDGSPDVGELAPGASGERRAFVRVTEPVSRHVTDPMLRVTPTARFSLAEPRIDGAEVAGTAVERKVAGAAQPRAAARYFTAEGDQIGRGPLPPKVGSATRYWIFASLETGATLLHGGAMSFTLPAGVAWTGRASATAGADPALEGDRLVWRLGDVAAHAGASYEAPSLSFEVALTPSAAQAGTSPLLVSRVGFTGRDGWTGADLASEQPGLTTQLPGDPGIEGRSEVRP